MNHQLFIEWFPQIMYNHHQTGPAGAVIFMPPFRDPFNYNFDPLIPLGIEMVGTAMHSRLVAEGKGGRRHAHRRELFHLVERRSAHHHLLPQHDRHPDRDHRRAHADATFRWLPTSSCRRAIGRCRSRRRPWHYRQSIDYEMTNNRAMLDLASRYRETLPLQHLAHGHELHRKGQQGLLDHHAQADRGAASGGREALSGGGRGGRGGAAARCELWLPAAMSPGGGGGAARRRSDRSSTTKFCTIPKHARSARLHYSLRPGRFRQRRPSSSTRC